MYRRLAYLCEFHPVDSTVVAPVPWFPFRSRRFGRYGTFANVPQRETLGGFDIHHPRYPVVPRLSWHAAPWLLYRAVRKLARSLHRDAPFDVVDAHFFYPDGIAAIMLAHDLGLPVCVTARGSDINLYPDYPVSRQWIKWGIRKANAIVTVSSDLKSRVLDLGGPDSRTTVLRNGVDSQFFRPLAVSELRSRLAGKGALILSVGNLVALKGHELVVEALRYLPGCSLAIIGEGPGKSELERAAAAHGVADRVTFIGNVTPEVLREYYSSADALVLASSREGWANVLLESMACGTPVIATPVGSARELISAPEAGIILAERSAAAIAEGFRELQARNPDRERTRAFASRFGWEETVRGQYAIIERLKAEVA